MNLDGVSGQPVDGVSGQPVDGVSGQPVDGASGQSLAQQAYYAIRDLLVTLQIPPGAPLQEERLCSELGFGRTPVREAIKRLEVERLVVVYPRRGTFASEINITDHALIADIRRVLEGHAAQRAAELAGVADRALLRRLLGEIADPGRSTGDHLRLDARLHQAIARCTGNRYLEATLEQYYQLSLRIWYVFLDRMGDVAEHVASHRSLLEAVIDGDAPRARQLAIAHVEEFESMVLRIGLGAFASLDASGIQAGRRAAG